MADGEEPDESQKTEDPTPKKLDDARKKGQVAMSREVNNWIMLFMGAMIVLFVLPMMADDMFKFMALFIEKPYAFYAEPTSIGIVLKEVFNQTLLILLLPFGLLMLAGFIGPFSQVGPLFAPESLKPSLDKISIEKGIKRIFSMRSVMEFLKGIFKLVAVGLVATLVVLPYYDGIEHLIDLPLPYVVDELKGLMARVFIGVLIILLVMAIIDYVYQRMEHWKKMRMTKQEVKDEYKTSEGDPHVKGRLRQLRQERGRSRIMQAVPLADVVIVNPTHYAVALKYNPDESPAPICVAKGLNETALRIREIAEENDIVIQHNPPLARALYASVEVDETIPYEHFEAVAKIISYVFKIKKKNLS